MPVGSSLNLGSIGIPTFRITSPAAAGVEASEAAKQKVESVVLSAAKAAAAAESLPDDSRAMATMGALSALLLAGGLLIDRLRKNRHVIAS